MHHIDAYCLTCLNITKITQNITKFFICFRRVIYGKNEILVKLQTILTLILLEVLNPFYIFQVFTICVWFAENYIYYTFAIMTMSLFGVSSAVIQTRQVNQFGYFQSNNNITGTV